MACPRVMPSCTRWLWSRAHSLGGARTSDLHAWDWTHAETVHWLDAHVPRPKAKSGNRMALSDVLVPILRA